MMKTQRYHQKLPTKFSEREKLRNKGQFWTPTWVAEAMASYLVLNKNCKTILDPAFGEGIFFKVLRDISTQGKKRFEFYGNEIDRTALANASAYGLSEGDIKNVRIGDFLEQLFDKKFDGIIANPPYIRHHRIPPEKKEKLKQYSKKATGKEIDGRAGIHVYFLIKSLTLLEENGRLAFIMPADTCEGKFSQPLWKWITKNYFLEAVITFSPDASPFPGVDTNPIIFLIKKETSKKNFLWAKCNNFETPALKEWVSKNFKEIDSMDIIVHTREIKEGITTGLSRDPISPETLGGPTLGDFAKVMRGIATGNNEFFFLTKDKAKNIGIPNELLLRAIGRTKDANTELITEETLLFLEKIGRPTLLFSPNGRPLEEFPPAVREYIKKGEEKGIHKKALVSTRKPWYKMETRSPPPFLFSYLGRRNVRFIRNLSGIVPLTGFLCIYPNKRTSEYIHKLWKILQHPKTLENLRLVAKSYGGGAIKVEPRSLERLPIPKEILEEVGLNFVRQKNIGEFFN